MFVSSFLQICNDCLQTAPGQRTQNEEEKKHTIKPRKVAASDLRVYARRARSPFPFAMLDDTCTMLALLPLPELFNVMYMVTTRCQSLRRECRRGRCCRLLGACGCGARSISTSRHALGGGGRAGNSNRTLVQRPREQQRQRQRQRQRQQSRDVVGEGVRRGWPEKHGIPKTFNVERGICLAISCDGSARNRPFFIDHQFSVPAVEEANK